MAGERKEPGHRRSAYDRPQRPARLGLAVIAAFVLGMGAWSALAPLSDAAIAQGLLQVEGRRQSVQHPYGGVIEKIMVTDGQTVEEGEPLLVLSDAEPRAQRDVLVVEKAGLAARRARLIAERDGGEEVAAPQTGPAIPPPVLEEALKSEGRIMEARNRLHQSSLGVLRSKIEQLQATMAGARAEAAGLRRQAELIDEELDAARTLLEKGYTPRPRVLALEREASQLGAALAAKEGEIGASIQAIEETRTEIARLERGRVTSLTEELRAAEAALAGLEPKLAAAEDMLRRTTIEAPATGEVVAVSVFTEGGVIQAGTRLMEIVPSASAFFVDARLRLTDLYGISAGQAAQVQLLSAPRSLRPDLAGTVRTISADRLTDERTGEGYYALQVALDADDVSASGFGLRAGMPVQVVIATEPRTLIHYLTGPLLDEIDTAFREY